MTDRFEAQDGVTYTVPDGKPTNAKDRAASHRLDLTLFPMTAIAYGALGMTEGDCKYGGYNYRVGGVQASVYVAAAMRHLADWFNGQECDPKTGVPHIASALACGAILADAIECGVLVDDRPPEMNMKDLLDRFEQKVKTLHEMYPEGPNRYTEKLHGKPKISTYTPRTQAQQDLKKLWEETKAELGSPEGGEKGFCCHICGSPEPTHSCTAYTLRGVTK